MNKVLLSLSVALAGFAGMAWDVALESSDTGYGSSFADGTRWSDKEPPSSTKTYYVGADKTLNVVGNPGTFQGKQLAVAGTIKNTASSGNTVTWPDLVLLDGATHTWAGGNASTMAGQVTVDGTARLASGAGRTDGRPWLSAQFVSDADADLTLGRVSATASRYDWQVSGGDWSSYLGTLRIGSGVTLTVSPNPFVVGGTIAVEEGGELYNSLVNWGVTKVGTLELKDGSYLKMRMFGTNGIQPISVTNALTISKNVTMSYYNNSPKNAYYVGQTDKQLAVFELSAEAAAKAYDLTGVTIPDLAASLRIGPFPRLRHLVETANAKTGGKTVYAKYEDDTATIFRMKTQNGSAKAETSAFLAANASYWDWAGQPTADSTGDIYATKELLFHSDNQTDYAYPNLECTIAPGHIVYFQTGSVLFKRWHFTSGSSLSSYTGASPKNVNGPIATYGYTDSSPIRFLAYSYVTVNLNGDLSGNGDVKLTCMNDRGQPGLASFGLYGDNRAFSANLSFVSPLATNTWDASTSTWKDLQFPKLETGRYLTVAVTNGNAFGGTYAGTTAWRSLYVSGYAKLAIRDNAVFDEPTRGLFVENGAQVDVAKGKTFTVGVPLTLAGEIIKQGGGTLVLTNAVRFIDGQAATEPLAGTNVLSVTDGALKVAGVQAANGLALSFAEGAKLRVDVAPAADGMAETGFLATRWPTPFATTAQDGKICVELEGALPMTAGCVPICTVTAAAAETVSFKLVRSSGYRVSVSTRTNSDGTVTFLANYERLGLMLILR